MPSYQSKKWRNVEKTVHLNIITAQTDNCQCNKNKCAHYRDVHVIGIGNTVSSLIRDSKGTVSSVRITEISMLYR